jgi:predicted CxxxxCH...CXXCH cytochrome family protein
VPTSTTHSNGTVDLTWGGLAVTAGARPSFDAASGTCSNTYCHGEFVGGNTLNAPIWNRVDGSQVVCGSCHTIPPPAPHIQSTSCGNCHTGYTSTSVNAATHVNGSVDVGSMTCTSCHGDPSRVLTTGVDANAKAAPPVDTAGQTASTAVGAHQAHLFGSAIAGSVVTVPIACTECHIVPSSIPHSNGTVDITWGKTATTGGGASYPVDDGYGTGTIAPSPMAGSPAWTSASATCSSTYCHGNYSGAISYYTFVTGWRSFNYSGNSAVPAWNGGPMTCGSCHAMPPNNAYWHSGNHGAAGGNDCQLCHPDATGTITSVPGAAVSVTGLAITNPAQHVNGTIELKPQWADTCYDCH